LINQATNKPTQFVTGTALRKNFFQNHLYWLHCS